VSERVIVPDEVSAGPGGPVRYRSDDEDSGRWEGFGFRPGDIVISTRSKSGTTWMQMICALLIFQTPDLPQPLGTLSPWLDWLITPRDEVLARLEAQRHRRFIKTHTPLDGVPLAESVTYLVVGRHPLDMAVSLYHQSGNINRSRVRELTGQLAPDTPCPARLPVREWLLAWIDSRAEARERLDSLRGVMWHLSDAWARLAEGGRPQVILVHYDDLSADLGGQMRALAGLLGIEVPEARWPELVRAATFEQMRARAAEQAPDPAGVLKNPAAFFRRGRSGAGREVLTSDELAHYYARSARLAAPDLLAWLHGSVEDRVAQRAGPVRPAMAG
jgi:aryl sulfotransferase